MDSIFFALWVGPNLLCKEQSLISLYSHSSPFPYMHTNAHPILLQLVSLPWIANPAELKREPHDKLLLDKKHHSTDSQKKRQRVYSLSWVHLSCWVSISKQHRRGSGWRAGTSQWDSCRSQHGLHWDSDEVSDDFYASQQCRQVLTSTGQQRFPMHTPFCRWLGA